MSEGVIESKARSRAMAVLAALFVSACGGGGGGGSTPAPPPIGAAPAPVPADGTKISGDTQAEPNKSYLVDAANAGPITVTLPSTLAAGDTVMVTGVSATGWQIGLNPGQYIATEGLAGNTQPGTTWTPHLGALPWWWLSSSASGEVLAAAANVGSIWVSTNGGASWAESNTTQQNWISVDMTPSGQRIVAVGFHGGMFISDNTGTSWRAVTPAGLNFSTADWESVVVSDDGSRIAATVMNGPIYVSTNGGTSWTARAATRAWRTLSMTGNGQTLVAGEQGGRLYTSTDGGTTWTARAQNGDWYRTAISESGALMVAGEHTNGLLYISRDAGVTWTPVQRPGGGGSLVGNWTAIAISADSQRIVASAAADTGGIGAVYVSNDAGVTFTPLAMPGTDANWRAMAMSADGNALQASTGNDLNFNRTGQLYSSVGNRTTVGTGGGIAGVQGDSVTLEYAGSGRFNVRASSGGPFTIR